MHIHMGNDQTNQSTLTNLVTTIFLTYLYSLTCNPKDNFNLHHPDNVTFFLDKSNMCVVRQAYNSIINIDH